MIWINLGVCNHWVLLLGYDYLLRHLLSYRWVTLSYRVHPFGRVYFLSYHFCFEGLNEWLVGVVWLVIITHFSIIVSIFSSLLWFTMLWCFWPTYSQFPFMIMFKQRWFINSVSWIQRRINPQTLIFNLWR